MEYLAVKSQTREGLLKYNYWHPYFGYIGLSNSYDETMNYYLHLQLIKEKENDEPFLLAIEGETVNGFYLSHMKKQFCTSYKNKPFDKT